MRALVTGSTGFVGSFMCRELLASGYEVRALHRARSSLENLEGLDVERVVAEFADLPALRRAAAGMDCIFHIGALYRQAKFPDHVYFQANAEGTRNVFEAACSAGVARVIHCSTIGVHSHIAHPPANETEPYAPTDVYQQSKVEAEKIALDYFRSGRMQGAVIRPAMIWGPRDTRFLKMFRGIAARRFPIIGSGEIWTHWILVEDLVRAFRLAAETPSANGEVFIIAGERPVRLSEVVGAIARNFGVAPLPLKVPAWPIQLAGSLVELLCRPFGIEPPLHRRRVDFFVKDRAFDTSKARSLLGFSPRFCFEDEVRAICDWYLQHGWVQMRRPIAGSVPAQLPSRPRTS